MFEKYINRSEVISQVVNNPADPYGPPLVKYVLRVRERETGRWYYVRVVHPRQPGRTWTYTFTTDKTYAKLMSLRTARTHQGNMTPDILNH